MSKQILGKSAFWAISIFFSNKKTNKHDYVKWDYNRITQTIIEIKYLRLIYIRHERFGRR